MLNQKVYDSRKIKMELTKEKIHLSRRTSRIMKYNGLVSAYTIQKCKPQKTKLKEYVNKLGEKVKK